MNGCVVSKANQVKGPLKLKRVLRFMLSLLDDFRVCNDMGPVMEVWSGEGPLVFGFCAGDTSSALLVHTGVMTTRAKISDSPCGPDKGKQV